MDVELQDILYDTEELEKLLRLQDLVRASEEGKSFTDAEICSAFFSGDNNRLKEARDALEVMKKKRYLKWNDKTHFGVRLDAAFESPKDFISDFNRVPHVRVWSDILIKHNIIPKSTMLMAVEGSHKVYAWRGHYGDLLLASSTKAGVTTAFENQLKAGMWIIRFFRCLNPCAMCK